MFIYFQSESPYKGQPLESRPITCPIALCIWQGLCFELYYHILQVIKTPYTLLKNLFLRLITKISKKKAQPIWVRLTSVILVDRF